MVATNARRRAAGVNYFSALLGVINANPRRYGGYIAHIGLITAAIGMTGSSVLRTDFETTLRPGEAVELREYTVRFDGIDAFEEPHRFVVGANLTVFIAGKQAGTLFPRLNYYTTRVGEPPITTPGVRSRADNDLYVNLLAFAQDGTTATLDVIVEPLVVWIWIGSFIVAFGALVSMWPRRRRSVFTAVPREEAYATAEAA